MQGEEEREGVEGREGNREEEKTRDGKREGSAVGEGIRKRGERRRADWSWWKREIKRREMGAGRQIVKIKKRGMGKKTE